MRQDQIDELEIMLDDYGLERVLDQIAGALERRARRSLARTYEGMKWEAQAAALRAQGAALAAGRALTYATQAPLGV